MRETHLHNVAQYIPGDYWMTCEVCGQDYRRSDMEKRWDNAWVCYKDWEKRNSQEDLRGISEDISVPVARPVPAVITIGVGDVTQDDL